MLSPPCKTRIIKNGGSVYALLSPEMRRQANIDETDEQIIIQIAPYQPTKQRLLESFKVAKLPVVLTLKSGRELSGYISEVSQVSVTVAPENPETGTSGGMAALSLVKKIIVNGQEIDFNEIEKKIEED